MKLLEAIDGIGTQFGIDPTQRRYIQICNRVSAVLFILTLLLFTVSYIYFQWITSTTLALVAAFSFLVPPLLNHLGFISISRITLILIIIIPSVIISILDKFDHPDTLEEFEYFQFRVILLGSAILPFILFSLKERWNLLFGLSLSFIALLLYDPIHNWFHAGFFQMGFSSPNYYFLNYIILFSYLVLTGSTYFLKYSFEKSENENEYLIKQLSDRQKEILNSSDLLRHQREKLLLENRILNKEIIDKNNQLTETNKELIRHNNELQQFSYTISHNLRGPVASLTGLLNLIDHTSIDGDAAQILSRLKESVFSLDGTIRDLSYIIDIRNDITRIRQKLYLQKELNHVLVLLKREIEENSITVEADFVRIGEIYSVRPMLESILYNLVSNAIKYRSTEHKPLIRISSDTKDGEVILKVEDNGLGIDLDMYGEKLFGLYKRFHSHREGKGLGLFLVKLQTEALDGKIEVYSELGKGTSFILHFPIIENIEEQVIMENKTATLYFNASLNSLGIHWKNVSTFEESKNLLEKSIEFCKNYKTPNWISNMSFVLERDEARLNEYRKGKRDELRKAGLKRIALIIPIETRESESFANKLEEFKGIYDVDLQAFTSLTDAKNWIDSENQKDKELVGS